MPTETDAGEWDISDPRWAPDGLSIEFQAYRAGVGVRFRISRRVFEDRYGIDANIGERKAALLKHAEAIKAGAARKLEQLRPPPEDELSIELRELDW